MRSYAKWLAVEPPIHYDIHVCQRHTCTLTVEDADFEILLDEDRSPMSDYAFKAFSDLAAYSGETFHALYRNAELENWVDESRIRKTFYGETPKST